MPSPFPGMDPYLETPALWPDFHQRMITYFGEELGRQITPRYRARIEERLVVLPDERWIRPDTVVVEFHDQPHPSSGPHAFADEEVMTITASEEPLHEAYIEIIDLRRGREVITVLELLSPTNKTPGDGRDQYLRKQQSVLASRTSLVEIDLLRGGLHTVAVPQEVVERKGPHHYLSCVRRGWQRDRLYVCRRRVRDPLVPVRTPLAEDDQDVALDLPKVFAHCYDAADYRSEIDYTKPPPHPLEAEDAAWADELLRAKGFR